MDRSTKATLKHLQYLDSGKSYSNDLSCPMLAIKDRQNMFNDECGLMQSKITFSQVALGMVDNTD